jgi:alkylation response protein AidB-like acyl-CoA dehydrogenase
MNSAGILMLGPMLIRYGTEEQKARFLPDIQRSTVWWAQGFSEPESGSDLASVRTRATLRGDAYIVEGRKIWTSYAHFSDMMFCLVRTGGPGTRPQEGISLLLLDMQSKGVSVRPIPTTDRGDDLNEVVLDGVEVPKQNLVGQEGQGWECAKYLLGFERASMAGIGDAKQLLQLVKNVSSRPDVRGLTPLEDPAFASQVRQLEIELVALEATAMRLTASDRTATYPGMVTPMLKVLGTELRQKLTRLALEAGGLDAIGWPSNDDEQAPTAAFLSRSVGARYLDARKFSIYGGTNEIQRSLIGRALLSNG